MNYFSWANYNAGDITEKTKYWFYLWEEIIDNLSRHSYDRELVNPHSLLMSLVDEIKYNKLKNKKNNDYFFQKAKFYENRDKVIREMFKTDFQAITSELSQTSKRHEYFTLLCEKTLESFQKGIYFRESCDLLKNIILTQEWKDKKKEKDQILYISESLIIELILLGYSIKKISRIPIELFAKYDEPATIYTEYPLPFDRSNYHQISKFNGMTYDEAVKAEINSLTISDRVDRLKYYFDKKPSEGYGIFHIEGLKGNIDVNIGEVNFYLPCKKEEAENSRTKVFNNFKEKKMIFYDEVSSRSINAAAKIKYLDYESAKTQALNIIEKSLDVLRLHIGSEIPFRVRQDEFHLVDSESLLDSSSYSSDKDVTNHNYQNMLSPDLKDMYIFSSDYKENLDKLGNLLFNGNIEKYSLSSKLIFSLHWYRKAFETNMIEDKLLNYWIVIESLITFESKNENVVLRNKDENEKFILAQELVPFIELSYSTQNVALYTYGYLSNLVFLCQYSKLSKLTGDPLNIPQSCLDACQLQYKRRNVIKLEEFIEHMPELSPYLLREIDKDKIDYAQNFYNNPEFAHNELKRKMEQTKQDLLLIYRYRNLIVHNAHFDSNILPYYVAKAENLARNLLRIVFDQHIHDSTKTHQEILLLERIRMERIIERLKNKMPVDLWAI